MLTEPVDMLKVAMLMLGRKLNEAIVIDGRIRVEVSKVNKGSVVTLAIDAPKEVTVDREEVHEKKMRANSPKVAAQTPGPAFH